MRVLKKYEDLATELYTEPKNEQILGPFLVLDDQDHNETMNDVVPRIRTEEKSKGTKRKNVTQVKSRDIRALWAETEKRNHTVTQVKSRDIRALLADRNHTVTGKSSKKTKATEVVVLHSSDSDS